MHGLKFDDVMKNISEIYNVVNNAFVQYWCKHFPFFLGKHREVVMIQFQRTTVYWGGGYSVTVTTINIITAIFFFCFVNASGALKLPSLYAYI